MILYNIVIDDKYVKCNIKATDIKQEHTLLPQEEYTVNTDFYITGIDKYMYKVEISELVISDADGNEISLKENGDNYVSLEDYIESVSDAHKWYEEWLSEREEREKEYWQDKIAEFYDLFKK